METIDINKNFTEAVENAAETYLSGGVFVYPTDTIYGFGGDPFNSEVSRQICAVKGRDESKMFIQLVDSIETLREYAVLDNDSHVRMLESIWPDRISVVLTLNKITASILGTHTAAFRIPDEKFCRSLLSLLKKPLISTSVNRSGERPLNEVSAIVKEFGDEPVKFFYYTVAPDSSSSASTIIDLSCGEPRLIREGTVKFERILKAYNG